MTVLNDLYDYGLKIYQDSDFFKFNLDSILLAEFVKYHKGDTILDICTGNAPIPLILANKERTLKIDAIELQPEIYDLATKSIQISSSKDQIHVIKGDATKIEISKEYDIITCNPPYFRIDQTSQKNENKIKRLARHEVTITLEQVIHLANKHLAKNGSFYLVHRPERFLETIKLLEENRFGIRKVIFIYTKEKSKAKFFLLEASKYKKSDIKVYALNVEKLKTYQGIFKEV